MKAASDEDLERKFDQMELETGSSLEFDCEFDTEFLDLTFSKDKKGVYQSVYTAAGDQEKFFRDKDEWSIRKNGTMYKFRRDNMDQEAAGTYRCVDSRKNSVFFDVTVEPSPTIAAYFDAVLEASVGEELFIGTCSTRNDSKVERLTWMDQYNNYYPGSWNASNVTAELNGMKNKLELQADRALHKKKFMCVAEYEASIPWVSQPSEEVNIKWKPKDVVIAMSDDEHGHEDGNEMICSADANPAALYTWEIRYPSSLKSLVENWRFNQPVTYTELPEDSQTTLVLVCKASNSEGSEVYETTYDFQVWGQGEADAFATTPILLVIFAAGLIAGLFLVSRLYKFVGCKQKLFQRVNEEKKIVKNAEHDKMEI